MDNLDLLSIAVTVSAVNAGQAIRAESKTYHIPKTSLFRRRREILMEITTQEYRHTLSRQQEEHLDKWVLQARLGWVSRLNRLRLYTHRILAASGVHLQLGKRWPRIKTIKATSYDYRLPGEH